MIKCLNSGGQSESESENGALLHKLHKFTENEVNMSEVKTKVLVIGGGVSGIAAATHFLKNQFESFTIVEAENRTGGRIHSFDFFDHVIELGLSQTFSEFFLIFKIHSFLK